MIQRLRKCCPLRPYFTFFPPNTNTGGDLTKYFQSAMYSLLKKEKKKREKHMKKKDRVRTGIVGSSVQLAHTMPPAEG